MTQQGTDVNGVAHGHWMRQGRGCIQSRNWAGAIRAFGQGLIEQPLLGMHYAANLELARHQWRQERIVINHRGAAHTQVVVAAAELSHNAAGRAFTLAKLYQHLGHPVAMIGCLFWDDDVWQPIRGSDVVIHSFRVWQEQEIFEQAWELVLKYPADLVHLSKPRLPAVLFGLLYKLLWGSAVLMDIDDEELCFVGESEPISLDGLKRLCHGLPEPRELMGPLWTRLAVDLAKRFDGITVASQPLQERYGGTVIPHARDPHQFKPATAGEKLAARLKFNIRSDSRVVLFFGTPRRHKGLLALGKAVSDLSQGLNPLLVVAGSFATEDEDLRQELQALIPPQRLLLLGNQPVDEAAQVLALADLVVLLSEGEVARFQSPAKLSDAMAMGLPVVVSDAAPFQPLVVKGWVIKSETDDLAKQLHQLLCNESLLKSQGKRARFGFEEILATSPVAKQLQEVAVHAMTAPRPADGRMINFLESLMPCVSSPLMAYRYRQWSEQRIDWQSLQALEREPELVSIVVPVYGDPFELDGCLDSVRRAKNILKWELIAVMNDDSPGSLQVVQKHAHEDPRILIVRPGENVQFALGCNLGFASARGSWLILLNNDCRVSDGWADELIAVLKASSNAVAAQPRLLKRDGTVQCMGIAFESGRTIGHEINKGISPQSPAAQECILSPAVSGACMATRAQDYASCRGMNPVFINSQEDVDYCLRACQLRFGGYCVSASGVSVVHGESMSPGRFTHVQWSRHQFTVRHKDRTLSLAFGSGSDLPNP